jgi:hypothetical protein
MPIAASLIVLLLASHHATPSKKSGPAPAAAPTPAAVDAAAAKAAAKALGVTGDLLTRVEKYARDADAAAKGSQDGALCALVDSAASLGADLHAAIPGGDPAKIAALEKAAPGLRVAVGPDGGKGGASYEALSKLASAKHRSSVALLAGAGGMLDAKHPSFIVMKNEEQGCTDYSRSLDAIQSIASGWKNAPACLKQDLKEPLMAALADDELPSCWCADSDHAAFDTKHYAAALSSLKDFGGPDHAKLIMAEVDDSSARFTCNAP